MMEYASRPAIFLCVAVCFVVMFVLIKSNIAKNPSIRLLSVAEKQPAQPVLHDASASSIDTKSTVDFPDAYPFQCEKLTASSLGQYWAANLQQLASNCPKDDNVMTALQEVESHISGLFFNFLFSDV